MSVREGSGFDIEPDVPPAVGQDGMFATVTVSDDGQPRRQFLQRHVIGIVAIDRQDGHVERGRIEIGMPDDPGLGRSEEHTSELQSLMRISYAVFCLNKKKK